MPTFSYRVAREDGRVLEARAAADNEAALRERLVGEGYVVFSVTQAAGLATPPLFAKKGISARDFLVFNQELMTLLKVGVPIMKVFDILTDRPGHPHFLAALRAVQNRIRAGGGIADAMAEEPTFFSALYVSSLRAGEKSGNLVEVIGRFMAYQRRVIDVKKKVVAALAYPTFLLTFGMLVLLFLVLFVMPKFAEVYADSDAELPGITRALLAFTDSVRGGGFIGWIVGGGVAAFALWRGYQQPAGRRWADRVILRVPLVGPILRRNDQVRIARTLSSLLKSGIPLVGALQIVSDAMLNASVREKLEGVTDAIRAGGALAPALAQTGLFPRISTEMIGVGEVTSALEEMLNDVAGFHEEELDLYLARVTTWVEPVLLLAVGSLIAVVLVAMYLPIFNLAGVVQ